MATDTTSPATEKTLSLTPEAGLDIRPCAIGSSCWCFGKSSGQLKLVADGALPAPSDILARLWVDWSDYPPHIWATLEGAGAGFLIGNIVAILAGVLFATVPITQRLARGINVALFALPPICHLSGFSSSPFRI